MGMLMYVCLCNRITDRDFRAQTECGGCTVSAVYRALGKKPQCGKCVPFVRQLLRQVIELPQRQPATVAG